jgi:hypothetical protein
VLHGAIGACQVAQQKGRPQTFAPLAAHVSISTKLYLLRRSRWRGFYQRPRMLAAGR